MTYLHSASPVFLVCCIVFKNYMSEINHLDLTINEEKELEELKFDLIEEAEQELNLATGFLSARVSPIKITVPLDIKSNSAPVSPSRVF